jgi:hypothetical protein
MFMCARIAAVAILPQFLRFLDYKLVFVLSDLLNTPLVSSTFSSCLCFLLLFSSSASFSLYFYLFVCISIRRLSNFFSGGRSRSTRREPPTMGKQLVNFITCDCESSAPFL